MHHPRRQNVTTLMVGLKKRSHMQKSHPKMVNPRDIAGERRRRRRRKMHKRKPGSDLVVNVQVNAVLRIVECSNVLEKFTDERSWLFHKQAQQHSWVVWRLEQKKSKHNINSNMMTEKQQTNKKSNRLLFKRHGIYLTNQYC